jgi:hypothetical protein
MRHEYISKDKIKMKVEACTVAVNRIELAQEKVHWSAFVMTVGSLSNNELEIKWKE